MFIKIFNKIIIDRRVFSSYFYFPFLSYFFFIFLQFDLSEKWIQLFAFFLAQSLKLKQF